MDDVILLSPNSAIHRRDICVVLAVLDQHNWRLRLSKCRWHQTSLDYVGYRLTTRGWLPTDSVLQRLHDLTRPTTMVGWRALTGWLLQSVRFLSRGLQVWPVFLQASCSGLVSDWHIFLSLLGSQMVRLAHASPQVLAQYHLVVDSSTHGWGTVLIDGTHSTVGSGVLCCASGLWPKIYSHLLSNDLEAEAILRAKRSFVH